LNTHRIARGSQSDGFETYMGKLERYSGVFMV
jgi:hypothetical protein